MSRVTFITIVLVGSLLSLGGCASIANGRYQQVPVISSPEGADVTADCGRGAKAAGQTPVVVKVSRKADRCVITVQKEGYGEQSVVLKRRVSGWVWGNLFMPYVGVSGTLIDLFGGAAYRRTPASVDVHLTQETASAQ